MKKPFSFLLVIALLSCNEPGATNQTSQKEPPTDTTVNSFFPVADYIAGQIKVIDSLQLPVSKKTTIGKTESLTAADTKDLIELARQFQSPDFTKPGIRDAYKETSFADQSIPSVTFNYTTTDTAAAFQRVDVIINPDPVKADQVRSIYMEKNTRAGDTLILQKLYWKADKHMLIITGKRLGNLSLPIQQVKLTWDPTE
jgi:hypothetical protein